jgi:MFS family permease
MSAITGTLPRAQIGVGDYLQRIRSFSKNARLYIIHIVGMDVIYGAWQVLFNLYLLQQFANGASFTLFGSLYQITALQLVGARLLVAGIAGALGALPVGMLSDRLGRKYSFILGDYVGAIMALGNITTANPLILLITPVFESIFGTLHQVSEAAFMAENSDPNERVHLFSVASSMRTLAALSGALLAGFASLLFLGGPIAAYRNAAIIGVAGWTLSLIPALLLEQKSWDAPLQPRDAQAKRGIFANVQHPSRIARLVAIDTLGGLGAAVVIPLFSIYFRQGVHAHDADIGVTFASGSLLLAFVALFAPVLAQRLGAVPAIVAARLASLPFVLLLAFAPDVDKLSNLGLLSIAGGAYVARTALRNMTTPIASAFMMGILAPQERGTAVGAGAAMGNLMLAIGGFAGASLMNGGDFRTPFFIMALLFFFADVLYWVFFAQLQPIPEMRQG